MGRRAVGAVGVLGWRVPARGSWPHSVPPPPLLPGVVVVVPMVLTGCLCFPSRCR